MGPAYVGICLPSTCEATKLESFLNEKLNETIGGLFKPMGSKIVDEIKDAVYTSEPRPFTTGDIVTMYIAHSGISRHKLVSIRILYKIHLFYQNICLFHFFKAAEGLGTM